MSEQVKFEVGDKVKAFGCEGVVEVLYEDTVGVKFQRNYHIRYFYTDGKLYDWHKEPSLFLIEKAKKVKQPIRLFSLGALPY